MKIGIDIRTLMDARYSGVSEYTLNLIKEILKLDSHNEYRLFYNSFGKCSNIPEFSAKNVKLVKYNYPNKILNYLFFKFFNYPKIDKELKTDVFFMPHINFIGLTQTPLPLPSLRNWGGATQTATQPPLPPLVRGETLQLSGGWLKTNQKIITVHDLSFLRNPEFFSLRKNFWHSMVDAPRLLKKFDRVIAISENTKRDIIELCGISPDKI
ncbi:MAG: hypothetical protein C0412_16650, partial [Flavobacterium sp.]|nr:hypothetical protein [Flavobacterium sp.]